MEISFDTTCKVDAVFDGQDLAVEVEIGNPIAVRVEFYPVTPEKGDSPTFADTLIPALADPASYDPATVAYLTELFGELSDSVKESILRTWGRLQDVTNKVAGLQLQSGGKVNALGSITGLNEIDLSDGTFVTATLTGAIQLTFTGLPTAGYVKDFVLYFTNLETITFPTGTKFAGSVPPVVIASPYMFVCSVDSAGGVTVYSLTDNIIVPV